MTTCLIVLNYNDYPTTAEFVNFARKMMTIEKIIVVDNNSTDDSYEKLKDFYDDKIDIICTKDNRGYAFGNNYGAYYAIDKYAPQYIIIANPDVVFEERVVKAMERCIEDNNNSGVVACKMKCVSGIKLPVASKIPTYKDCILENLMLLRRVIGNTLEYDESKIKKGIVNVDALPGSLFMISADVFKKVGGFDENTFLYYEENILAYRLKTHGYNNFLIADEEYIHKHSVSINKNIESVKKRLELAFSSRYYFCKEYLNCNYFQLAFLKLTFFVGLFDYLIGKKILKK